MVQLRDRSNRSMHRGFCGSAPRRFSRIHSYLRVPDSSASTAERSYAGLGLVRCTSCRHRCTHRCGICEQGLASVPEIAHLRILAGSHRRDVSSCTYHHIARFAILPGRSMAGRAFDMITSCHIRMANKSIGPAWLDRPTHKHVVRNSLQTLRAARFTALMNVQMRTGSKGWSFLRNCLER
jgi:hypothetical protein